MPGTGKGIALIALHPAPGINDSQWAVGQCRIPPAYPILKSYPLSLIDKCQDIVNSFLCQDIGYTYFLAGNRGNASSP